MSNSAGSSMARRFSIFQVVGNHFMARLAILVAVLTAWPIAVEVRAAEKADLRGYGKVETEFAPGHAVFRCADAAHADLLLGKLLADLFWDAGDNHAQKTVEVDGTKITVHIRASHGVLVVGRVGSQVIAIGAADDAALIEQLRKHPEFLKGSPVFAPGKPYPIYLDYFDLGAMKIYTYAMSSLYGNGLSSHWPFIKKVGLSGTGYHLGGGMVSAKSPVPGLLSFIDADYEVREAERNHGMIVPGISVGGAMPPWAVNLYPQSVARLSPTGIAEEIHGMQFLESLGMSREERETTGLWSLRQTMRRYLNSPAIGGWHVLNGPAGIEVLHAYQETVDFSETGLKGFREYLKNVKGFDLKTVGMRYYNDPAHYKSWDEVMPMDANGFVGNLDESCLLLKNWQWQLADAALTEPPAESDSKWRDLQYPGSDQMHAIPAADAFYRIGFDASQWIANNPSKDLYLVCGKTKAVKPVQMKVWLNGKSLGERGGWWYTRSSPETVKVNDLLKPGINELKLWVPKGKLVSPFFLTTHKGEQYPSSDKLLNARYVDLKDWHYDSIAVKHKDAYELARGIDTERPFTLAAGGGWEVAGGVADIATRVGSSIQNTGREAFYQPWWARLGRIAGYYSSSEPSATTTPDISKPASLNRLFGWVLIDADSSHILYWRIDDYIKIEKETGWFTKNKRLMSLVGKALPPAPQIAVFRSSQTMRYSPEHYASAPWTWDIGRGEINDAHYNWGYASERELRLGLPKTCKVVFDSGSEVMDQSTIDAITSFVSNGGTFVALHNTGRHDPIEANAWPISRLTGCKVVGEKANGKITFGAGLPMFKGWDGRVLQAAGVALDFGGNDHAKDKSVKLSPQSGDVQVLAKWDDGTAAVTSRTIGKGRVVCLGSTFWRNARDKDGAWISRDDKLNILDRLFTDLGVERGADVSLPDVWVGNFTTKNGLEDWLIAFNTVRESKIADLKFRAAARPAEVRELVSGQTVPFEYADGWIQLKQVNFDNTQTKVFSVKRADLADGLAYWWAEKTTYWKRSDVPEVKEDPRDPGPSMALKIDSWKFLADRDDKISSQNAWNAPQFNDGDWGVIETGPWNSLKDELKDYTGIGLYRASFTISKEWTGTSISLNLYGDRLPKILGAAEFFLNGKKIEGLPFYQDLGVPGYPARIAIDDLLVGGRNVLAVKIKGGGKLDGEEFSGFGGSVYLAAEKPLKPELNLDGKWTLVRYDNTSTDLTFPFSNASGKYLAKTVEIPASWAGRRIYLRLETQTPWLAGIMVNGKLLLPAQFRRMGRYVEWNLTNWVEPGQNARLEFLSRTPPFNEAYDPKKPPTDAKMDLLSIKIGCLNGK